MSMDARAYFQLTDAIAAAGTSAMLQNLRDVVGSTEMNPVERKALERVLRSRADALRLADLLMPRPVD